MQRRQGRDTKLGKVKQYSLVTQPVILHFLVQICLPKPKNSRFSKQKSSLWVSLYVIVYPSPEFITTSVTIALGCMGMAATTLEMKASEASNDLKSIDQRMLIMEMWNWYQPNSEKLMTLMATLDQVIFFCYCFSFRFNLRHPVQKMIYIIKLTSKKFFSVSS